MLPQAKHPRWGRYSGWAPNAYGSLVLSDLAAHYLTLVREPCGRRGRLNGARLLDKQGDAKLTDHVPALANCEMARAFSLYDRCKALYVGVVIAKVRQ